ncbi:hypothetical protein BTVI_151632 [Pitangus sulphuratus]|nr:hypothetical protein BTVI_151632 [Pitangus sulphuratus]
MGWLPCGPDCCTGARRTRGVGAGNGEGAADELNQVPEKHPLGPWPLKALLLLEDSGDRHLWRIYHKGLKNFLAFREGMALSAVWPIPVDQIREFLVAMESQDLPPTKIIMYMKGLSFISIMVDYPDPLQDPVICSMISRLSLWQSGAKSFVKIIIKKAPYGDQALDTVFYKFRLGELSP